MGLTCCCGAKGEEVAVEQVTIPLEVKEDFEPVPIAVTEESTAAASDGSSSAVQNVPVALEPQDKEPPQKLEEDSGGDSTKVEDMQTAPPSTAQSEGSLNTPGKQKKKSARVLVSGLKPGPEQFTITLRPQPGHVLGADLTFGAGEDKGLLRVKGIKPEGLVADWNKEHPEEEVQAEHFIISVNGRPTEKVPQVELLQMFRAEEVKLEFSRTKPVLAF
mmetsp:Transcript_1106/g.2544  ORF Transcript_1106/g.2544 Transcript_1106/m.2544 type:complete len:218 (+) Transcript_1106:130-783(+)